MNGWPKKMNGNQAAVTSEVFWRGVKAFLELSKAHLSGYIALSAVAGHVLAQDHLSLTSLVLGAWVFLLAAGSGVLNNIQDCDYDRRFSRTRNRVLPRGFFPLEGALIVAWILMGSAGTGLYFSYASPLPFMLGMAGVICYNGLYTPMKKNTLWAMVPGTLCGMVPPAMGWSAVPGHLCPDEISGLVILMACLGIWQFPHYLLVGLKQGEGAGGFQRIWPGRDLEYQVLIWTALFCLGMALFLLQGWVVTPWLLVPAFVLAVILAPVMAFLLLVPGFLGHRIQAKMGFLAINLSMFFFLSLIIFDRLFCW